MYLQYKLMPIDNGVFPFPRASSSEETRQGGQKKPALVIRRASPPPSFPLQRQGGSFPRETKRWERGGRCWVEKNAPALRDVSRLFPLSPSAHAFDYTNGGVKEADGSEGKLTINL